jgi:hypothetical protein
MGNGSRGEFFVFFATIHFIGKHETPSETYKFYQEGIRVTKFNCS